MTSLRLVDDVIELNGEPVAKVLPKLRPTLVHRLVEAFDVLDEDAETIALLESRIALLESRIALLEKQRERIP